MEAHIYGSSSWFPIAEAPEIFHKCLIGKREVWKGKKIEWGTLHECR